MIVERYRERLRLSRAANAAKIAALAAIQSPRPTARDVIASNRLYRRWKRLERKLEGAERAFYICAEKHAKIACGCRHSEHISVCFIPAFHAGCHQDLYGNSW
jgi:hypothetical protein